MWSIFQFDIREECHSLLVLVPFPLHVLCARDRCGRYCFLGLQSLRKGNKHVPMLYYTSCYHTKCQAANDTAVLIVNGSLMQTGWQQRSGCFALSGTVLSYMTFEREVYRAYLPIFVT